MRDRDSRRGVLHDNVVVFNAHTTAFTQRERERERE